MSKVYLVCWTDSYFGETPPYYVAKVFATEQAANNWVWENFTLKNHAERKVEFPGCYGAPWVEDREIEA